MKVPDLGRLARSGVLRAAAGVAVLGVAAWLLTRHTSDITDAEHTLSHLQWGWLAVAVLFEALSMVAFAALQSRLLNSCGRTLRLVPIFVITVASNAITRTLPGGVGWAAAWEFEQFGRRGVRRFVRVWTFLVAGAVSSFCLFVIIATGVLVAGGRGPFAGLRWLVILLGCIPLTVAIVAVATRTTPIALLRRFVGRREATGGRIVGGLRWLADQLEEVQLGPLAWAEVALLALTNWLSDVAVLVACILCLGLRVPWQDTLVIYGLSQVAGVLPISAAGLGVAAVSMGTLLTAYGMTAGAAVAVVVIYRVVSDWAMIPVGWLLFAGLEVHTHRSHAASPAPGDEGAVTGSGEEVRPSAAHSCWDTPGRVPVPSLPDDGRIAYSVTPSGTCERST